MCPRKKGTAATPGREGGPGLENLGGNKNRPGLLGFYQASKFPILDAKIKKYISIALKLKQKPAPPVIKGKWARGHVVSLVKPSYYSPIS